jgi:hypothetical protein
MVPEYNSAFLWAKKPLDSYPPDNLRGVPVSGQPPGIPLSQLEGGMILSLSQSAKGHLGTESAN